jgi:DNA-directed RNA polymerase specialized sigma24 family protein
MLRRWKSEAYTHEDIVIQRYDWLLNWAMKLTGHSREEAEDLVHDAFVEFTLSAPDLASIQNMEGYLYGMLRNIHMSRVRRTIRVEKQTVNLLDYDSAEVWLRSVHIDSLINARELLGMICDYACERKETSKAGSILILRFFHGYYPGEIARIALCHRRAVDDWMLIARKEARFHIEQCCSAGTLGRRRGPTGHSSGDFLDLLRARIFESRKGRCFSENEINDRYSGRGQQPLDRRLLAHISSCPVCLERINRSLGLPPLSDRFPTDMLGNDVGGLESSSRTTPQPAARIMACRRLARSVYHHEPRELTIVVNGFFAASETVEAKLSERTLAINPTERLSIIETFSEQGVRLLGLHVQPPPDGPLEQSASVELSEGRRVELSIDFKGVCPSLKSSYYDPRRIEPALLGRSSEASRPDPRPSHGRPSESSENASPALPPDRPRLEKVPRGRSLMRAVLDTLVPRIRPATVTAAVAIVLAAIIIIAPYFRATVSAAELLRRAVAADDKATLQPDTAIHRRLVLEERTMAPPVFVTRRQLDVWASPVAGLKGCRVYDDNGLLIAGEWVSSTGVHSVYRRDTSTPLQDNTDVQLGAIIESGEVWRIGLSAKDFLLLVGQPEVGLVVQGTDSYTINYEFGESSRLVRASLVLNKSGLQAFEETLVIRRPQGIIQYRFTEKSHETVPLREARPSVFYPDPWIPGANTRAPAGHEAPETTAKSGVEPAALTDSAIFSLKLDAMYRLHRAGACLAGQTSFTRPGSSKLGIQVLTENDSRKSEVISALGPLARNSEVELDVSTFGEAAAKRPPLPSESVIVKRIEIDRERIPAYSDLRRYFGTSSGGADQGGTDEATTDLKIERFAAGILKRSRLALLHAWALRRHAEDVDGVLSIEQRSLVAEMVADHLRVIQNESARLATELAPIFTEPATGEPGYQSGGTGAIGSIDRLYELVLSNENAISAALTVSASGEVSACPIRTAQFWRSLKTAERLAASMLRRGG